MQNHAAQNRFVVPHAFDVTVTVFSTVKALSVKNPLDEHRIEVLPVSPCVAQKIHKV